MGVIGRGVCGRVRNLCLVCFRSQGYEEVAVSSGHCL